ATQWRCATKAAPAAPVWWGRCGRPPAPGRDTRASTPGSPPARGPSTTHTPGGSEHSGGACEEGRRRRRKLAPPDPALEARPPGSRGAARARDKWQTGELAPGRSPSVALATT